MKAHSSAIRLPFRRGSVEYSLGTEADHEAVYQTLLHVFHGPDRESFLGALNDPAYRPEQRLLAKVDGRVVSHVHLTEREIRFGCATLPMNGVMWVGTLPEFRGLGFAQNLMRLADERAGATGHVLQALTTGMPQFYRPLGWGVCGRQTYAQTLSRNLPQASDGVIEGKGGFWHVRPWRQVELGDLMSLYEMQFAQVTGTVDPLRRILAVADRAAICPCDLGGLPGRGGPRLRVREGPPDPRDRGPTPPTPRPCRPCWAGPRRGPRTRLSPGHRPRAGRPSRDRGVPSGSGRLFDQEIVDGSASMYHIPDLGQFLKAVLPELTRRAACRRAAPCRSKSASPPTPALADPYRGQELAGRARQAQPPAPRPCPLALVRLLMGHTGIDRRGRRRFRRVDRHRPRRRPRPLPPQPIWRSPLDAATA